MTGPVALSLSLAFVMLAKIAVLTGVINLPAVPRLAVLAVVLLAVLNRRISLREAYLISLSCLLTALFVWIAPERASSGLARGLDQAVYLMCFIVALGLVQEAASTSSSIMQLGHWLTRQPPQRRFAALYTGSGLMSVVFNLGTVSFLVPLIQRGIARGEDDGLNPVRMRRQVSALLRGFSWAVIWSPTAIAPVMVARLLSGVERGRWIVLGIVLWAVLLATAMIEDAVRFRHVRVPRRASSERVRLPWLAMLRLTLVFLIFLGVSLLAAWMMRSDFLAGLLVAAPAITVTWLLAQAAILSERPRGRILQQRLAIIGAGFPGLAPVAVTLACSGFIGYLASELVPADRLALALDLASVPDALLLSLLPLSLMALSLMALSPTMTAVFLADFSAE